MKNAKQQLDDKLAKIAALTQKATSQAEAVEKGLYSYLEIEYPATGGRCRLISVKVDCGGHFGAFGGSATETWISAKEMLVKLDGILTGIGAAKSITPKK